MPEEPQEIRSINWKEVFTFSHLFRGFRMAIDPKKLLLSFAALVSVFVIGKALDVVWPTRVPAAVGGAPALAGEPKTVFAKARDLKNKVEFTAADKFSDYILGDPPSPAGKTAPAKGLAAYGDDFKKAAKGRDSILTDLLIAYGVTKVEKDVPGGDGKNKIVDGAATREAAEKLVKDRGPGAAVSELTAKLSAAYADAKKDADKAVEDAEKEQKRLEEAVGKVAPEPKDDYEQRKKAAEKAAERARKDAQDARLYRDYGLPQGYAKAVENLDLLRGERVSNAFFGQIGKEFAGFVQAVRDLSPSMALYRLQGILLVPAWLIHDHPVYAAAFLTALLLALSFFGGAVTRVAAVQFARDEKISFKEALAFAWKKKISFIVSPLIPVLIIGVIGVIMAAASLLANIPVFGEVVCSLLLFLALLGGFIMALVAIGTVAGIGLMHPTIAVEGSDAFDAISRSFSYVYSRPFTAAFYAVVAALYGVITYVFVRFFAWLMLWLTHSSISLGVFAKKPPGEVFEGAPPQYSKLEAMWNAPGFDTYFANTPEYLTTTEAFSSGIIAFWVGIVSFLVAAYVVSFIYSELTIIYYLLRNQVDATELDDVYLEEPDEEFTEMTTPGAAKAGTGATGAAPTTASAEPAKPKIDLPLASPTPSAPTAAPATPPVAPTTPPTEPPATPPTGSTPSA